MIDTISFHGRTAPLDPACPLATAVAVEDGVFAAVGGEREVLPLRGPKTLAIDLQGRSAIAGLDDRYRHVLGGATRPARQRSGPAPPG